MAPRRCRGAICNVADGPPTLSGGHPPWGPHSSRGAPTGLDARMEPKCKIFEGGAREAGAHNVPLVPVPAPLGPPSAGQGGRVGCASNNKSSGPRGGSHKFIKHTYKKKKLNQVLLSHGNSWEAPRGGHVPTSEGEAPPGGASHSGTMPAPRALLFLSQGLCNNDMLKLRALFARFHINLTKIPLRV